jgi:hypothetical protein
MFRIIEFARMMVGTKAISTLSTGYLNALEYAKERVQGTDLANFMDKAAPKVTITHHPDVRRSLMTQKAYAEGMRSLVLYTASVQDSIAVKEAAGEDAKALHGLNDLLLPIVKGYGSEKGYEQLAQSLQTFGGSGFLQEYPLEQYIRDAKIDSLYEGTTAIQSLDLFFRKMVRDQGAAAKALLAEVAAFATDSRDDGDDPDGRLKTERAALAEGLAQVEAMLNAMTGFLIGSLEANHAGEIYKIGQQSVRLLLAFGDLIVAWLLARQAEVAGRALDHAEALTESDRDFYAGKLAVARFFTTTVLPRLESDRKILEETTNDLMEIPETAF